MALAPGPQTASSGPANASRGLARSPCATMPARGRPLPLRPRWLCAGQRRVRTGRYLGTRRGSIPTGRPARRSRCSPPAPQWNRPRTSPTSARGTYASCSASPPLPCLHGTAWTAPIARERAVRGWAAVRPRPLGVRRQRTDKGQAPSLASQPAATFHVTLH